MVVGHRAPPARPGWIRVGWELFLGYLFTAVVLLAPAALLGWLGVFSYNAGLRRPQRIVDAPFYPGGIWAVVADLAVGAVVVVFVGLMIHGSVLRRTDRGFADLTVLGLDPPARVGDSLHPFTPTQVGARHSVWLLLPVSVCRHGVVHVRYRVLGSVHSQPLLLPSSSCSGD